MLKKIFVCLSICLVQVGYSQGWKELHVSLSAMRPAAPFSKLAGVFESPFHPLFEAGASYRWNKSEKNIWDQNINIGYGYHRFLQSIVPLYTSISYRRVLKHNFQPWVNLGFGYLHSFPLNAQFVWNNGAYERTNKAGNAQVIIRLGIGVRWKQFSLVYENFLQAPFIRSYVPLMPYNVVTLGYHMPIGIIFKSLKNKN